MDRGGQEALIFVSSPNYPISKYSPRYPRNTPFLRIMLMSYAWA